MSCTSCQLGLPCSGEGGTESDIAEWSSWGSGSGGSSSEKSKFKLFGDPTKNRNTLGDLFTGGLAAIGSAQARQGGGYSDMGGGPSMVRIPLIGEVPVTTAVIGGIAALGVGWAVLR